MKLLIGLIFSLPLILPSFAINAFTVEREEVKNFLEEMVDKHGFNSEELHYIFSKVDIQHSSVLEAISRPAEAMPWFKYRSIFLQPERIKLGVKFWQENFDILQDVEKVYGVPPEIIVAIIGVETRYGSNVGSFKIINSLSTLAFGYTKRNSFFTKELEHYLLLAREQNFDPLSLDGSYAGAIGIPQFMPSSYREYAVDYDNDKKIDIWSNTIDAIGSVGNYLKAHGWKRDELITTVAEVKGDGYSQLLTDTMKPSFSIDQFESHSVTGKVAIPENAKLKLLELETENGNIYWIGLNNFYVITRYNHSVLYAMAVYQLASEIYLEYTNKTP